MPLLYKDVENYIKMLKLRSVYTLLPGLKALCSKAMDQAMCRLKNDRKL
jgi:hypothetical protein